MIGETIISRSNGTHLPFGCCVIHQFRDGAKLLSSLAPIPGIVDVRMGQSDHTELAYTLPLVSASSPSSNTKSLTIRVKQNIFVEEKIVGFLRPGH
jgi:hypothetical protein